jgi:beta-glucosidase
MTRDIDALVQQLTLDEKASLTVGADNWSTVAIERVGLPAVFVTDGPNGARGPTLPGLGDEGTTTAVCVPCGAALGATWDVELLERVGALLGEQARTKACRVLLAPTVNLHRSPLAGRNFESYSEDPLLAGKLAAAFVRGAQSRGVATTVKHFAGNEYETERMSADSVIDERTLRELYLLPFELAVREGGSLGIMTAYNRLNGTYGPDNHELLDDLLRGEWGFEGFVVTDWFAQGNTVEAAKAGLDLEMPGPRRFYGGKVANAVREGDVDESLLDAAVTRLLGVFDRLGALDDPPPEVESVDRPEDRALARETAAAGIVLLKNDGDTLPLSLPGRAGEGEVRTLAVVGPNAERTSIMGGGSAQLHAHYQVTILDALRQRLVGVGGGVEIVHEPGADTIRSLPAMEPADGFAMEVFAGPHFAGEPVERSTHANGELWCFGPPSAAAGRDFSARLTATFAPEPSVEGDGPWLLSLAQSGRARLLIDGEVVVDGMAHPLPPGPSFLGTGSEEVRVELELEAGRPVEVVVELANPAGSLLSGVRVGARRAPAADLLDRAVAAAAKADAVLVVVGTSNEWESEGHDRDTMDLPGGQDELVTRVLDVRPDAVVVVNAAAPVSMPWADRARAIAQVWFGGQEAGNAVVDVLTGDAEPGGRLPTTIPVRLEHNPTFGNFAPEHGEVRYGEGLLVGYRWYEARRLPTRFPFGHGLSYTSFSLSPPRLSSSAFEPGGVLTVEVDVTNTGTRTGSEVVQCYVAPQGARPFRPVKELKAFAKVNLEPGATTTVRLELDDRSFAYWNVVDPVAAELAGRIETWLTASRPAADSPVSGWTVDPGTYELHIGRSSADIAHVTQITMKQVGDGS